jgi:SAM-dependent methyltransferase
MSRCSVSLRPGYRSAGRFVSPTSANVDIVLPSEFCWPNVPSESFDAVVTVSTLEHTRHPWLVVQEIARIMKPGGLACLTAPFAWPYHAHPIDCWRIYPDGMEAIMRLAGFEVLSTRMCNSDGTWRGDTVGIGRRLAKQ